MESDNVIKRIRKALNLSQAEFGVLVKRSHQSIRAYEAGVQVPADVLEKAKVIAAERGMADLALDLASSGFDVKRVFHPGEKIISTHPAHPRARGRQRWHDMLDDVYASDNIDAINAVEAVLFGVHNLLAPAAASAPKTKAKSKTATKKLGVG